MITNNGCMERSLHQTSGLLDVWPWSCSQPSADWLAWERMRMASSHSILVPTSLQRQVSDFPCSSHILCYLSIVKYGKNMENYSQCDINVLARDVWVMLTVREHVWHETGAVCWASSVDYGGMTLSCSNEFCLVRHVVTCCMSRGGGVSPKSKSEILSHQFWNFHL